MNALGNVQPSMDVMGASPVSMPEKSSAIKSQVNLTVIKEPQKSTMSRQDVEEMVDALKDLTETLQTKLNFSVREETNNIVVKVIDKNTNEVIRQFPPEEILDLQEKMQELTGFLLNFTA